MLLESKVNAISLFSVVPQVMVNPTGYVLPWTDLKTPPKLNPKISVDWIKLGKTTDRNKLEGVNSANFTYKAG